MSSIASRYAKAFFDLVEEQKKVTEVHADVQGLSEAIRSSEEFKNFLQNPAVPQPKREEILLSLFQKSFKKITLQFLKFLNQKNRLSCLEQICSEFNRYYNEARDILPVTIISSAALNKTQLTSSCEYLQKKFKKTIEPDLKVDKSMIGGIKVQAGDTVYDFSIQTFLQNFKDQLIHA